MARKFNNVTFPDELRLKYPLGAGKTSGVKDWHLEADFRVFWTENGIEKHHTAEAGLVTDMSSTPWWAQWVPQLQKAQRMVRASIVHDDLYGNRLINGWKRIDADDLFYAMLRQQGVWWLQANLIYRAVRIGGERVWLT